jgi:tetratricopeptide (TPR) repeat protein
VTATRGVDLDRLAELEEQRDFLLRSLDDLEAEWAAGEIDEGDYETLRDDYTARAAEVLRAIDQGKATLAEQRPPFRPGRLVAGVALIAVLAVGAGVLVARSSGDRLAGETITGDIRETNSQKLAEASRLFQDGQALEAIKKYDEVIEVDPDNREALAYRGWLVVLAGLEEEGLEFLDRAIAVDPDYPDARFFKGFTLRRMGDLDGALVELRAFLANDPPPGMTEQVKQLIETIEAEQAGEPTEPAEPTEPTEPPEPGSTPTEPTPTP